MVDFELEKVLHAAEGNMRLGVSARMEKGTFTGLYGPSGAGKTSVLRMLAGLMKPDGGRLVVDGEVWYDAAAGINILTQKRNIGIVFQDYALFPNMNVRENIAFALTRHESRRIVDELLELTGLQELASRRIQTLSGGQQQRVALARAIAKKPSLLLLDEPLSALDNVMRQQLQATLLQVHRHMGLTTILVSHNEEEITRLCDTVLHLDRGRFRESVAPEAFFKNTGAAILQGSVVAVEEDGAVVAVDNQLLTITSGIENMQPNDRVEIDFGKGVVTLRRL